MTGVLIRRKRWKHKHRCIGRTLCDDGSRDCSDAAANQGIPRIAGRDPKLGTDMEQVLLGSSNKGTDPPYVLILTSLRAVRINFCCLIHLVVVLWYSSPGKLIQT